MRNKIYFLAILLFSVSFLSSCSSDDDNGSTNNTDLILGKWMFYQDGEIEGTSEYLEDWEHDCPTKKDYLEFTSGGDFFGVIYDTDCSFEGSTGTYEINGNLLKVTTQDYGVTYSETLTIETLNSTTLRVTSEEEYAGQTYKYVDIFKKM